MIAWDELDRCKYNDEREAVAALLASPPLDEVERAAARAEAIELVKGARRTPIRVGVVESFLHEFSLNAREGLALMCLAEALLRIPDNATRDRLIAEKIGTADWGSHLGASDNVFVNASTWGLMLTGRLVDIEDETRRDVGGFLRSLTLKLGEPVIRSAVGAAVRIMGEQFVLGGAIDAALARAKREGLLCSFDMLGEGARSASDAERYEQAYALAIEAVGRAQIGAGPEAGHGISIKLSALSPRYEALQEERVWAELYPRLMRLARLAATYDINCTIDAEEADRLVLSLKLMDRLAREPELGDWTGLGLAVQAYQKRALYVIARLRDLARSSQRRLMVRLVKGAYWDSEIKRAQTAGRRDYPVWTTKPATDVSYLACAKALIEAAPDLYPQFATHNAHTLASVRLMGERAGLKLEYQRLHGMGEALYAAASARYPGISTRVYAPVGRHEDLLPYLVRRLLENGANSSFVHTLLDKAIAPERVVVDPIAALDAQPGPHPRIATPTALYEPARRNSIGDDIMITFERERLVAAVYRLEDEALVSGPIIAGVLSGSGDKCDCRAPADRARIIGSVIETAPQEIDQAFRLAHLAQPAWNALGGNGRVVILRAMADALENGRERLIAILVHEAGKTYSDAISEVREAVDFCRFYASEAGRLLGAPIALQGPAGERNTLELRGRGVFACISPWNFPLAIFTGQIAAALAAGNAVLAKPAEQTPLIAAEAVRLFHGAGLDPRLLALLPGDGERVGGALVQHPGLNGVAFTGGTDTASSINRALAARPGPIIPLIAETGGLNAMIVDTSALREQVIDDAIVSAFNMAGQRCSALRILFLPEERADKLIEGLKGAMDALVVGDPAAPQTDIGPMVDEAAHSALDAHLDHLTREAKVLHRAALAPGAENGWFFTPTLAEIPSPDFLEREVFGPILHVYRYKREHLADALLALARRGYGLTLGIHSRIENFVDEVRNLMPAGNTYVNRTMIGAVVGVQPFGGEGLSGTGPKAGGPYTLLRYAVERAVSVNIAAQGGDPALLDL